MRGTILLLVCVMMAAPMFGQQSVAEAAAQAKAHAAALSPDAPSHDQVMTLLNLLRVRTMLTNLMEGIKKAAKDGAEQSFRERVPNPTPAQLEALKGIVDDSLGDLPIDEMIEAMVPVYQRHLTKSDIDEMIRFYSSPVGQKLLREQPQMMQEGMQAGVQIQQKRMSQVMAKVDQRMKKMIEDEAGKGGSPKQ
jgi:hypothetical protein